MCGKNYNSNYCSSYVYACTIEVQICGRIRQILWSGIGKNWNKFCVQTYSGPIAIHNW